MEPISKIITLASGLNSDMHPDNTPNDFCGELTMGALDGTEYLQVAVVNVAYDPHTEDEKTTNGESKCLVILSDIADLSQFGAKSLPVIAVFDKKKPDTKNLGYYSVKRQKHIQTIRIQLVDENMKPIPVIPDSETIVTLRIRSTRYY